MRQFGCAWLTLAIVLASTKAASADDAAKARALVNKAIEAQGGEAKLAKAQAHNATMKGTFHGMGQAIPFTGEVAYAGRDKQKLVVEFDAGGMKFRIMHVLNGNKGWTKFNDDVKELDKEQLAEAQEKAYAEWVSTLLPLKDNAFALELIGESEIEKRKAMGVRVTSKDRRYVNLYFDKETNLLIKTEKPVKDDAGKEVTEESYLSDYKEEKGVKHALKFTVKRDGKLFVEGEVTGGQYEEKLDDSNFAKP